MKKLPWLPRFMLEVFLSCNIVIVLYDQSTKLKHAYRYLLFQVVYVSNSGEQKVEKGSNEMKHFEKLTKKLIQISFGPQKNSFVFIFHILQMEDLLNQFHIHYYILVITRNQE